MRLVNQIEEFHTEQGTAITFGKFDGFHVGHQALSSKVIAYAKKYDLVSVVCAFHMNRDQGILMSVEEKAEFLSDKVDCFVNCAFTKELREMSAEDFVEQVIVQIFHAKYVVVGTDFRFGKDRQGDVVLLEELSKTYGYQLEVVEKEKMNGRIVSSTYVREVLAKGDVALANTLMGHHYSISGEVLHGRALGHTLGFPTMNVAWPECKVVPPKGVYLCNVCVDDVWYPSVCNVGTRPTVCEELKVFAECYLFGFTGDAYGKMIQVNFLHYQRPEKKFHDISELKQNVDQDILSAKGYFENVLYKKSLLC